MSEYDWILEQYAEHGEDYVNELLDNGYVPSYVAGRGWRWILKNNNNKVTNDV